MQTMKAKNEIYKLRKAVSEIENHGPNYLLFQFKDKFFLKKLHIRLFLKNLINRKIIYFNAFKLTSFCIDNNKSCIEIINYIRKYIN